MKSEYPAIKRFPKVSPQEERKSRVVWARKLAEKLETDEPCCAYNRSDEKRICDVHLVMNELIKQAEKDRRSRGVE